MKMSVRVGHAQAPGKYFLRHRWDESPAASQQTDGMKHNSSTRAALEDFYSREVAVPERLAATRQAKLDRVLPGLLARVQRNTSRVRCLEPIYVGSAVEELDIRRRSDLNIVLPLSVVGRVTPVPLAHKPGLFELKLPRLLNIKEVNEDRWSGWRGDRDCLSPVLANQMFYKFITKWQEVRQHQGTAIEPRCAGENAPVRVVISLGDGDAGDDVLTIEIIAAIVIGAKSSSNRRLFVAKDYGTSSGGGPTNTSTWTQVSYESERALLSKVNKADDCCRAQALKILKALRGRDETLARLTTYQMKHALLHLCDEQVDQSHWQKRKLEHCFVELLRKLVEFVSGRKLPHFFVSQLNLLEDIPERTLAKIESRLKVLSKREKELIRLLSKE